jgi:hypothetical protein
LAHPAPFTRGAQQHAEIAGFVVAVATAMSFFIGAATFHGGGTMSRRTLLAAAALASLFAFGARAQQDKTVQFHGTLDGQNEVPAVQTQAAGKLQATLDRNTGVLTYDITYQGLSGPPTAMHFHGPAEPGKNAGVQVPIQAPLGSPVHGATPKLSDAQIKQLLDNKWYLNIHTQQNRGGEIRTQVLRSGPG